MYIPKVPDLPEKLFTSARLKFTAWYLFVIMAVSIVFSFAIYSGINAELQRFEGLSVVRREQDFFGTRIQSTPAFDPETISEARQKLISTLVLINLGILVIAGITGFLLAGKTLRPIEDMLEEQKRFTADASHELRTPLTAMKTEIEVALRDKNMNLTSAKKLLQSNLEETEKMQSLSNNLLSLARYQNSTSDLEVEKFSLTELVIEVTEKLQTLADSKKVKLVPEKKEVEIAGNRESIRELLTILIDNAVKYSHDKGEVVIKAHKRGSHTIFSVEDKGVGIKELDLPHIFDRFYRADSSRAKTGAEGYGLGLSIAKSIVDLHKGKIEVKSKQNQGTTFTVTL